MFYCFLNKCDEIQCKIILNIQKLKRGVGCMFVIDLDTNIVSEIDDGGVITGYNREVV